MNTIANDIELIQQTVECYIDGTYHSDVEKIKKALHPNYMDIGYFEGKLVFEPLEEYLKYIKDSPTPSESGEEFDAKIVSIDVTGNAAVVKLISVALGQRSTDYLSLLNVDGNWVIVGEIYYYEPK
jgi:hypothetical protein